MDENYATELNIYHVFQLTFKLYNLVHIYKATSKKLLLAPQHLDN